MALRQGELGSISYQVLADGVWTSPGKGQTTGTFRARANYLLPSGERKSLRVQGNGKRQAERNLRAAHREAMRQATLPSGVAIASTAKVSAVIDAYEAHLESTKLAASTQRLYVGALRRYLTGHLGGTIAHL